MDRATGDDHLLNMIHGEFDPATAKPYVAVAIQVIGAPTRLKFDFLIDSGASDIILSLSHARRLGVTASLLKPRIGTHGIGGSVNMHPVQAYLQFTGVSRAYVYPDITILVPEQTQAGSRVPTIIGQALLKTWKLTLCHIDDEVIIEPRPCPDLLIP